MVDKADACRLKIDYDIYWYGTIIYVRLWLTVPLIIC